jgi:hypothetical protein
MHTTGRVLVVLVLSGLTVSARAAGVVGDGTPGSCTTAALTAALSGGGLVTFDCGATETSVYPPADYEITASTTVDGGGRIALLGLGNRLFRVPDSIAPGPALTLRDLRISHGRCPAGGPPGVAGLGGALWVGAGAVVTLVDVLATDNRCDLPASEQGGGLVHVNGGGTLLLQRVRAQGNGAAQGSVVHAVGADVTIEDSQFFNNLTAVRGGNVLARGGRVMLRRCSLSWGSASEAGGVVHGSFLPGEPGLSIEDSTLTGYAPSGQGGAIFHQGGSLSISGSTLRDSRAHTGAALYAKDVSALSVVNSTVTRNQVGEPAIPDPTARGAAFFLAGSTAGSIRHTTIVDNHSYGAGGAFSGDATTAVVLRASIVEDNATVSNTGFSPSCTLALNDGGFNLQSPGQPADVDCAPGIVREFAGVGGLGSNGGPTDTHNLYPDSPARDRVTAGCPPPSTDQRGGARPAGSACDAGSVEWVPLLNLVHGLHVVEGNSGTTPAGFTVTLYPPATEPVSVAYQTADRHAQAGTDYVATSGVLTFPPGATAGTVTVPVLGDAQPEGYELFDLVLGAASGAVVVTARTDATIEDDDYPSGLILSGCAAVEGAQGSSCRFTVQATGLHGAPVAVDYVASGGTASVGIDFQATAGTLTLPPGQMTGTVAVPIFDDGMDETDETLTLTLSNAQNGTILIGQADGRIDDDDGPIVSVSDVSIVEGDGGQQQGFATVSLSAPSVQDVLVDHMPVEGTATYLVDYVRAFGTLVFSPGETTKTVPILVIGDVIDEPNERFGLRLGNPVDATVAVGHATVTIVDDDGGVIRVTELIHGAAHRADLAGGDDLYVLDQDMDSSWEVVVDEASGDLGISGSGPTLQRVAPDLVWVKQESTPVGVGPARVLHWVRPDPVPGPPEGYIRVSSTGCGTACGADDVYRIRAYETTLRASRFNCEGSQSSAVVLQSRGPAAGAWIKGWKASGEPFVFYEYYLGVAARGTTVFDVCTLPYLDGRSGSLTVTHTAGYGQLVGKVVQVDPATGASFDTPLTARPR